MNKNIFFIGFMGSGKSTIGNAVADTLNRDFIDLDDLIEQQENIAIPEIFKEHGEAHFRLLEHNLIVKLSDEYNKVIATGGGAPMQHGNIDIMKENGLVIKLKASIPTIWDRLKGCNNRPILQKHDTLEKFEGLYRERKTIYNKAHTIIETDGKSIEQVVYECIKQILA